MEDDDEKELQVGEHLVAVEVIDVWVRTLGLQATLDVVPCDFY